MKKKTKWGKALNKTKDPKTPNSFQTLAGVSMMMLQPITAGAGSTSTPDLVSSLLYLNKLLGDSSKIEIENIF